MLGNIVRTVPISYRSVKHADTSNCGLSSPSLCSSSLGYWNVHIDVQIEGLDMIKWKKFAAKCSWPRSYSYETYEVKLCNNAISCGVKQMLSWPVMTALRKSWLPYPMFILDQNHGIFLDAFSYGKWWWFYISDEQSLWKYKCYSQPFAGIAHYTGRVKWEGTPLVPPKPIHAYFVWRK